MVALGIVTSRNGGSRNGRVRNGRSRIGRSRIGTSTPQYPGSGPVVQTARTVPHFPADRQESELPAIPPGGR